MRTRLSHNDECAYEDADGASTDFDYAEVSRALGEIKHDIGPERFGELAVGLRRLMDFLVRVDFNREGFEKIITRRLLAVIWTINPGLLGGKSLTQIAKTIGIPVKHLSVHSAAFSREFGVRNHAQSHGWNWKAPPNA
jgi:hypothetical protein